MDGGGGVHCVNRMGEGHDSGGVHGKWTGEDIVCVCAKNRVNSQI